MQTNFTWERWDEGGGNYWMVADVVSIANDGEKVMVMMNTFSDEMMALPFGENGLFYNSERYKQMDEAEYDATCDNWETIMEIDFTGGDNHRKFVVRYDYLAKIFSPETIGLLFADYIVVE